MDEVTYSLKCGQTNSGEYYKEVRLFTDKVMHHADITIKPLAEEFIEYLNQYRLEDIREIEEYILELLSFGVLWRTYAAKALAVHTAPFITLTRMAEWRKKHQGIKPLIDLFRGISTTMFLLPDAANGHASIPTLEEIDNVCKWFEATGEFREQALRFIRWRAYWGTLSPQELLKIFLSIRLFTEWFEKESEAALGKYTQNVESFLQKNKDHYRWREDRIQCTRTRLEYHLNMVGAELMNRAFREEFEKTEEKVVLVPGCMRGRPADECEAERVKEGLICKGCLPACHVNRLREMGLRNNFSVCIIPHASDLSLWSPKNGSKKGVVASACVTTLVEGGWELKRYDVPAQCVLIDFSGCKKHWHCNGVSTSLNIPELKNKLGIKRNNSPSKKE